MYINSSDTSDHLAEQTTNLDSCLTTSRSVAERSDVVTKAARWMRPESSMMTQDRCMTLPQRQSAHAHLFISITHISTTTQPPNHHHHHHRRPSRLPRIPSPWQAEPFSWRDAVHDTVCVVASLVVAPSDVMGTNQDVAHTEESFFKESDRIISSRHCMSFLLCAEHCSRSGPGPHTPVKR